ncbi:serine hydrolase domain-containing protein, partial [Caulobacter sp. 17J65-9]|uniref:serine hydrolase domain-containing protein n=1 Tax=Caulobacter sp. 17J65-9 TaxID=2709382 RepID=UPI0013CCAB10
VAQEAAPATPTAAADPAQTTAGRSTAALLAALNGDHAARAAFVRDGFTARALQNQSAEDRLAGFDRLAAAAGGFDWVEAKADSDRMADVTAKARNGGRFARIVVFTSRAEPGKIADLFVMAARDPAKVRAEAWPTGPVSDKALARAVEAHAKALADEGLFSGAVLVARGDQVVFRRAYGQAEAAFGVPNKPETTFNIASMGKMFTAVAVGQLAEQGELSLDDTLAKWLPEYPNRAAAEKITLRQLLTHTSGLGDVDRHRPDADKRLTARSIVPLMTADPDFEPGARVSYSNAGFVMLAAVVEAASGQSFDDYVRDHVFVPAGMTRTDYGLVTAIAPDRARGYLRPEHDPLGFEPRRSNEQFLGFKGDGSGGAYSNVDDLFAFKRALFGHRLLSEAWTKEMLAPRVDFAGAARPSKYGYGFHLESCAGTPTVGHAGGGPNSGVDSVMFATADGKWTVIVLGNYDPPAAEDLALSICGFVAARP